MTKDDRWGDLMRAALAGDSDSYRVLLEQVAPVVRGIVRTTLSRAGRGNADIEDIVQEIMLAVHLKRGTWKPDLPFGPWLNAVVRFKIIDALRRQGTHRHVVIDDIAEVLPAPENSASDLRDAELLIDQLDDRSQRIVRAAAFDGLSMAEIAAEVDSTDGAVRVAFHRALKRLAELYRRNGR